MLDTKNRQHYISRMTAEALLAGLGRRARELRLERRLTLRELAQQASLSARFLVQVEAGDGNISVKNLALLAQALGTTPAALLSAAEADGPALPVVALLGLRGAGKSTVGKRLARRLRVPFVELDRKIEEAAGLSLAEIFALHGEDYYRRLEKDTLLRLLDEARPLVLACGGGLVTAGDTWAQLRRRAMTVWLRAQPEDHWNRVVQQGDRRPMSDHPQAMSELRRLLRARESLYAEAAHTVDTSRLSSEQAAQAVEALLKSP
jgi:XRE family aerobic/anaerobic benzoate catabolism transcriptional regulator